MRNDSNKNIHSDEKLNLFDRIFNIIVIGILLSTPVIVIEVLMYLDLISIKAFSMKYGAITFGVIIIIILISFSAIMKIGNKIKKDNLILKEENKNLIGAKKSIEIQLLNKDREHEEHIKELNNKWVIKSEEYKERIKAEESNKIYVSLQNQRKLIDDEWIRVQNERKKLEEMISDSDTFNELTKIREKINEVLGHGFNQVSKLKVIKGDETKRFMKNIFQDVKYSMILFNMKKEFYQMYLPYLTKTLERNNRVDIYFAEGMFNKEFEYLTEISKRFKTYLCSYTAGIIIKDFKEILVFLQEDTAIYIEGQTSIDEFTQDVFGEQIKIIEGYLEAIYFDQHAIVVGGSEDVIYYEEADNNINELNSLLESKPYVEIIVKIKDDFCKYYRHIIKHARFKEEVPF